MTAQNINNNNEENKMEELKIVRLNAAKAIFAMPKSSFYDRVKRGLIPPSISLGGRSVGWIQSELNEVIKAMAKGKSQDEIKKLVINLQSLRANI